MNARWIVHCGDVRAILPTLEGTFDAVLCDPPYELSNDGKQSPAWVAAELLFPKDAKVVPNGARECMLSHLVSEVLALSVGRVGPGPSAAMPEVAVTLDDDATGGDDDVEHVRESTERVTGGDSGLDDESEPAKYLGRFALECADASAALDAFNGSGACFDAGGVGIGFVVSAAGLPGLLARSGVVNSRDANVRSLHDALAARIGALSGAERAPVACALSLARTDVDVLPAGCTLQFLATLKIAGAKLVRADATARRLPSKFESRRIRIVSDATDRTLALDLVVHPQNVSTAGFMGKSWDGTKVAFDSSLWRAVLGSLRPGAPLLAFGGTRTYHRMACAIEDAGFEIRDSVGYAWVYGSGFPKSLDVGKAIDSAAGARREIIRDGAGYEAAPDGSTYGHGLNANFQPRAITAPPPPLAQTWSGYGTALKPAWEPCVLARKPLAGTVAQNVTAHGVGGLAIDACRVGMTAEDAANIDAKQAGMDVAAYERSAGVSLGLSTNPIPLKQAEAHALGRWPANLVLSHDPKCKRVGTKRVKGAAPMGPSPGSKRGVGFGHKGGGGATTAHYVDEDGCETVAAWRCAAECPVRLLDAQSGERPGMSGGGTGRRDASMFGVGGITKPETVRSDSGGASRFFYSAKVSTSERNDGLDDLPELAGGEATGRVDESAGTKSPRAGSGRNGGSRNPHPTMKPVALTEYLAKLILPPRGIDRPRRLLVPFCGVASEMVGALRAGWDEVVGIELSKEYARIARLRLTRVDTTHQPELFGT